VDSLGAALLHDELGGDWSYVDGTKELTAVFPSEAGKLLNRLLKRFCVPHKAHTEEKGCRISLRETDVNLVLEAAGEVCDTLDKPDNRGITIASKIADGSLKMMLDERDQGIYR